MSSEFDGSTNGARPTTYQIRIKGRLDPRWEEWFDGLTITTDNGDTLITGPVTDQAALHGLLRRVRDMALPLVSVATLEGGPGAARAAQIDTEPRKDHDR